MDRLFAPALAVVIGTGRSAGKDADEIEVGRSGFQIRLGIMRVNGRD